MTNQEVLEKAIQLAIDRGWNDTGMINPIFNTFDEDTKTIYWHYDINGEYALQMNDIIYNHDFARALWGGELGLRTCPVCVRQYDETPKWQYHLQQMVIADDPIHYLAQNLPEDKDE